MNKRIDFSNLGGFPATQRTFDFMQESYRSSIAALAAFCGDKVIVTGVEEIGGNVSAGWIVVNGELIPFAAGALSDDVVLQETAEEVTFQDNAVRDVYFTKSAVCGTPGDFPFSDLKRLDTLLSIQELLKAWLEKQAGYISYKGSHTIGDIGSGISSDSFITITIPDQGTTDYVVSGSLVSLSASANDDNDVFYVIANKTATSFTIACHEVFANLQNLKFEFVIIKAA